MRRRRLLQWLALAGLAPALPGRLSAAAPVFPAVAPRPLVFPRDHGAHPDFRTEWWYATGWLDAAGEALGFQITFFRARTGHDPANPSRFAPHQLLFAHAAVARAAEGQLRHEQRAARMVAGDAAVRCAEQDTDLELQGWRLRRDAAGVYAVRAEGGTVAFQLDLAPTRPLLLQGEGGYSRKGPLADQASHYYSRPQLAARGRVRLAGRWLPVAGSAWLDHEWSSRVLDADAAGWDWIGINLDDGGALMAFRIRARDGGPDRWAAARLRQADGRERSFGPDAVRFEPQGAWRSPRTGAVYPLRSRLTLGSGPTALRCEIEPLMEDQELDARPSTGAVYWEGAVTLLAGGRRLGRGYLELVGYHRPMDL